MNLLNAGHVAHRTVHNKTIVAFGVYGSGKIVTRERAVADLSEQIDDENVIRLEDVDHPRVFIPDASFFPAVVLNNRIHIRATWHENRGHDPAYQAFPRINYFPAALELIAITCALQHIPRFVGRNLPQPLKHGVRYLRPSVLESFAMPIRRERNTLFFGKEAQLAVCGVGQSPQNSDADCEAAERSVHFVLRAASDSPDSSTQRHWKYAIKRSARETV